MLPIDQVFRTVQLDLAGYATIASTALRIASRLGLQRRPKTSRRPIRSRMPANSANSMRPTRCLMNILDAINDPKVFAPFAPLG